MSQARWWRKCGKKKAANKKHKAVASVNVARQRLQVEPLEPRYLMSANFVPIAGHDEGADALLRYNENRHRIELIEQTQPDVLRQFKPDPFKADQSVRDPALTPATERLLDLRFPPGLFTADGQAPHNTEVTPFANELPWPSPLEIDNELAHPSPIHS